MISASVQVNALSLGIGGEIAYRCMLVFLHVVIRNHYKAPDRASTSYCRYNLPKYSFAVHTQALVFDMLSVVNSWLIQDEASQAGIHLLPLHSSIAYILVYSLTSASAPTRSPSLINFAMSKFSGLSASPPALSSCCTASNELTMPYAGVHDVLSRSRQISPVVKLTLGWQQRVLKVIVGGLFG